jgi:hypothetical protein
VWPLVQRISKPLFCIICPQGIFNTSCYIRLGAHVVKF